MDDEELSNQLENKGSDANSDGDRGEEEEEEEEEDTNIELQDKILEALQASGIDASSDDEDDEEELLDDEQMMAIDEQFAQVFRSRANVKSERSKFSSELRYMAVHPD